MESRQDIVMNKLCEFYLDSKNLDVINSVLHKESKITLRVLEWFITVYSRAKGTHTPHIYNQFKVHLKSYSKKLFDPFCRGERILLMTGPDQSIETTVGQLNFFRFIIEYNIIDEYNKNKEDIEKKMLEYGFKKRVGKL